MIAVARQFALGALLVALAASTPVIGWCATAKHQGQTLHPIFDHAHHLDHAEHVAPPSDRPLHVGAVREPLLAAEHGSSWSATGTLGSPAWLAGVQAIPPLPSLATLPDVGAGDRFEAIRPLEHIQAPTPPPPRRTA